MAYWQNGKCYVHGSMQSQSFVLPQIARYLGIKPEDLVFIAEYCGGGFGSKGNAYPLVAISGLLSKKANGRPVMLRVSREEEYANGSGRAGFQGWAKIGFAENGRITALDIFVVQDNGPNIGFWDFRNAGETAQIVYQPEAMRWRGTAVLTNTPPRGPQRGPGREPDGDDDRADDRRSRTQARHRSAGDPPHQCAGQRRLRGRGRQGQADQRLSEGRAGQGRRAVQLGREEEALRASAMATRSSASASAAPSMPAVRTVSTAWSASCRTASSTSTPASAISAPIPTRRPRASPAEVLGYNWDNVVIVRGRTDNHLPWMIGQFGSNTTYTASRGNYVAAVDAKNKLLEIAATVIGRRRGRLRPEG